MKRDIDLVRQLLLCVDGQAATGVLRSTMFEGYSQEKVRYHLRLLADSGFVKYVEKNVLGTTILRLTWDGHELLELARDPRVWDRAKRLVHEKTCGLSVEAIHQVLTKWSVQRCCEDDRWVSAGQIRSVVEHASGTNGDTNGSPNGYGLPNGHGIPNGHGMSNGNGEPNGVPRGTTPRFTATGPEEASTADSWLRWSQPEVPEPANFENFSFNTEEVRFGKPASYYNYSNSGLPIYLL